MARKMTVKHNISLRKAARLLSVSRSSLYYKAKGEVKLQVKLHTSCKKRDPIIKLQ